MASVPDRKGAEAVVGVLKVNSIAYNEECTALVSGGYDSSVRVWDCRSSSIDPIQVIGGFKDSVTSLVVTPRSIFAGSVDGTVSNYDIRMGYVVRFHCFGLLKCSNDIEYVAMNARFADNRSTWSSSREPGTLCRLRMYHGSMHGFLRPYPRPTEW